MAAYKATFEGRNGQRVVMPVEAPNRQNASEVAGYFQMANGKLVKVEAAK